MPQLHLLRVKRIYEPPAPSDGCRILVDRLWPRGISKEQAALDEWMKEIAPSHELRKWFHQQLADRFEEFCERYIRELEETPALTRLADRIRERLLEQDVTLLYAANQPHSNHAVVLRDWLLGRLGQAQRP